MFGSFVFHIQPVRLSAKITFQVRIGLEGTPTLDFVPAHRSAFAKLLPLEVSHETQEDAQLEIHLLMEALVSRKTMPFGWNVGASSVESWEEAAMAAA